MLSTYDYYLLLGIVIQHWLALRIIGLIEN